MSSALTPVFRPPMIIEGLVEMGERIPASLAIRATRLVPTFMPTWA